MYKKKVSIIVPVYNVEKYLRRCVDSILFQTFTDFEVLLVDDGSLDKSGKICDEYAYRYESIKAFHKQNGGLSSARNYGLDRVCGKWISFIDPDDYVEKDFISTLLNNNSNDDINVQVSVGYNIVGKSIDKKNLEFLKLNYDYVKVKVGEHSDYLEQHKLLNHWSVWRRIFSKKIIDKYNLRYNENVRFCEDLLFWHSYICKIKELVFVPDKLYNYYRPQGHKSLINTCKYNIDEEIALISEYKDTFKEMVHLYRLSKKYAYDMSINYETRYRVLVMHHKLTKSQYNKVKELKPKHLVYKRRLVDYIFAFFNELPLRVLMIGRIV